MTTDNAVLYQHLDSAWKGPPGKDLTREERIAEIVIERAEQACRYALKHQNFEDEDAGEYASGWAVGAKVCEGAIRSHVMRHFQEDVAATPSLATGERTVDINPDALCCVTNVDGVMVHGDKPLTEESREAVSALIAAAREKLSPSGERDAVLEEIGRITKEYAQDAKGVGLGAYDACRRVYEIVTRTLKSENYCPSCGGSGEDENPFHDPGPCPACDGSGVSHALQSGPTSPPHRETDEAEGLSLAVWMRRHLRHETKHEIADKMAAIASWIERHIGRTE